MKGSPKVLALFVLSLLGLAGALAAQSTVSGSLQGKVRDAEGGPLPGVTVTVLSDALVARQQVTVTDERGSYRFPSLPVGAYVVQAELSGFQAVRQEGVRVQLGQALSIDLVLQLATISETIEVSAGAPLLSVIDNKVST